MNARERARVDVLRRRATHLTIALDNWGGGDQHRAKAERSAVRWAVRVIEAAPEEVLAAVRAQEIADERAMQPTPPAPGGGSEAVREALR